MALGANCQDESSTIAEVDGDDGMVADESSDSGSETSGLGNTTDSGGTPVAPVLSPGCQQPATPLDNEVFTVSVAEGPSPRAFRTIVADGDDGRADIPRALHFSMHACGETHLTGTDAVARGLLESGIDTLTVRPNSAVVDAVTGDGNGEGDDGLKCWNIDNAGFDRSMIDALYEHLLNTYCIDETKVVWSGGSSGGFASQAFGCRKQGAALMAGRGGVHFWDRGGFYPVPPPSADACGPVPAFVGWALDDPTVPYDPFANVAIPYWIENNECLNTSVLDAEATEVVCQAGITNCQCQRYMGCTSPLVVCTWDGDHSVALMSPVAAVWWFEQFLGSVQ